MSLDWAILSPEYPPMHGGVADYSCALAAALAAAGDHVEVWSPASALPQPGVAHRRLPPGFGGRARQSLRTAWAAAPASTRFLVQYVPSAYGARGMNLPFTRMLRALPRRPWLMFHEVAYPFESGQSWRLRLLARMQRRMAANAAAAAEHIFVSIPAWAGLLRQLAPAAAPATVLPVPSNLPPTADPELVAAWRQRLGGAHAERIAFFGQNHPFIQATLVALLPALLRQRTDCHFILAGARAPALHSALLATAGVDPLRLHASGYLDAASLAALLAATDLLLQPYPDGISGRRGSAMAALALGAPLLTTTGHLTEPLWAPSQAVALEPVAAPALLAASLLARAGALLDDPGERRRLALCGQALYASHFSLEHTVRLLRSTHAARGVSS